MSGVVDGDALQTDASGDILISIYVTQVKWMGGVLLEKMLLSAVSKTFRPLNFLFNTSSKTFLWS